MSTAAGPAPPGVVRRATATPGTTSDAASALFFFTSMGAIWAAMRRLTPGSALAAAACTGSSTKPTGTTSIVAPKGVVPTPNSTIPYASQPITLSVANARLWSPETPHLYMAQIRLTKSDVLEQTFGIRTLHWDADKGFFLNGVRTEIKGMCNHQDHAGVGAALPDWICLPLAGILAAFWGMILGFPVLRLRGDYLAIVTLAFGEIIRLVLLNFQSFTGGPNGISSIPRPSFFGLPFNSDDDGFAAFFGLEFNANGCYFDWIVSLFLEINRSNQRPRGPS